MARLSELLGAAATLAISARKRKSRRAGLRGKVVLITGSSRGLGLALAEEFGRLGARIVLTARNTEELDRARDLLSAIDAVEKADDLLVVPADLRQKEDAEYLVHRVMEKWGQVDDLVNNAGIITVGPIENQTVQGFREVMDANFFTVVHCTLAALPQMLQRGQGTIVNITSIGGKVSVPHLLPYSASKFAAVGFSQGLHAELRGKGVHVKALPDPVSNREEPRRGADVRAHEPITASTIGWDAARRYNELGRLSQDA